MGDLDYLKVEMRPMPLIFKVVYGCAGVWGRTFMNVRMEKEKLKTKIELKLNRSNENISLFSLKFIVLLCLCFKCISERLSNSSSHKRKSLTFSPLSP